MTLTNEEIAMLTAFTLRGTVTDLHSPFKREGTLTRCIYCNALTVHRWACEQPDIGERTCWNDHTEARLTSYSAGNPAAPPQPPRFKP